MTNKLSHCLSGFLCIAIGILLSQTVIFAQQSRTVSGTITDTAKEPLAGAAVTTVVNGRTKGTIADSEGRYSIEVPGKEVLLEFSFLGMKTKKVSVPAGTKVINVVLESDNSIEEAVISTGYGVVQKRENLTGSAFQVTREQLDKLPSNRIDNLLAGLVPGLQVNESTTNGRPSVKIRIRGEGSLSASCEPLWIIDGVPIYTGSRTNSVSGTSYTITPMSFLNPDDIESMTVLKDAATTTIYGADGANGVILVTTRNGKEKGSSINARVKYGVSAIDRTTTLKYLDADGWRELAYEGWRNAGFKDQFFPYQDNEYNTYSAANTDWVKIYTGIGQSRQVNFSASGGNDKMKHFLSASYLDNSTCYKGNNQRRYSFRDKIDLKLTDRLTASVNLSGSYNHNTVFSLYSSYQRLLPIFDPYLEDGSYRMYNYYSTDENSYNLVARKFYANKLPEREYNDNYQNTLSADANLTITYTPFRDLTITSQTGASFMNIYESTYSSRKTLSGMNTDNTALSGYSRRSAVFSSVLLENLRANWSHSFGKHYVSAMIGTEFIEKPYNTLYATGNGFINDFIKEIAYADASTQKGSSTATRSRSLSYMGSAEYTYDRRYSFSVSERSQGNSAFSIYTRWANYFSAGTKWNIHNEKWFRSNVVDKLGVKLSYGSNGNSRLDSSSSFGSYSINSSAYYGGSAGAVQASAPNPSLSWETEYILNTGLNLGLFDRLDLNLEYYHKKTTDVLYSGRVSSIITDGSITMNVGEITNQGIEFELTSRNIVTEDFTWTTVWNGSRNRNMITELYKDTYKGFFDSIWVKGASKDAWWLVEWAGVDPVSGAPMWYDKNGDLTYTFSYDNRKLMPKYTKQPQLQGGMTNNFRYRNFSARVLMTYDIGGWDLFTLYRDGVDIIGDNDPIDAVNHWTTPGVASLNPKYEYKNKTLTSLGNSTRELRRMTHILVRNVSLSYDIPKRFTDKIKVRNVSVSLIADNLYLWAPNQSRKHNSYKTMLYNDGMVRTVSAELQITL